MTSTDSEIRRYGVVAVVRREASLLVIRRSMQVAAPGAYCFPGGEIEANETEPAALVREIREELGVAIEPGRRLWTSTTPWGVHLAWWTARLPDGAALAPNPAEVASASWHTIDQIRALSGLLQSNHQFLDALERGEFSLD